MSANNCYTINCKLSPSYGYLYDTGDYKGKDIISCKQHKKDNMIILSKICRYEDCTVNSSFGYIINNKQKYLRCKNHKEDDMIALYQKCYQDNCINRARYNFINEKGSKYCFDHKKNNMVDKNKSICIIENCTNYASFKDINTNKNIYCTQHSKNCNNDTNISNNINLISSKNKVCKYKNCILLANFGTIDDKRQYCSNHKLFGMVDHIHKRCNICNIFLMKHGNQICSFCNIETTRSKKEKILYGFFNKNSINFIYNQSITFDYLRPDFLIIQNNINLIIECDEKQHKDYDANSELIRMQKIIEYNIDKNSNQTIFIRFNPDDFYISNKRIRISIDNKLILLLNLINNILSPSNLLLPVSVFNEYNCHYLFYNCNCENKCSYIHSKNIN